MNRSFFVKVALGALAVCAVPSTASADECGNNTGKNGKINNDPNQFWSWYAQYASNNDCLRFKDGTRHFEVKWTLSNTNSNQYSDVVAGMGWEKGDFRHVFYNAGYWQATGNTTLSLYGWVCGTNTQEYYVVENWGGGSKYVPYDIRANNGQGGPATRVTTITADENSKYDIYITKRPADAANGCNGNKYEFYQYWSVRQGRRPSGDRRINFSTHTAAWAAGNRGFKTSGVRNGYQIMGAEGLGSSSGTLDMTVWK